MISFEPFASQVQTREKDKESKRQWNDANGALSVVKRNIQMNKMESSLHINPVLTPTHAPKSRFSILLQFGTTKQRTLMLLTSVEPYSVCAIGAFLFYAIVSPKDRFGIGVGEGVRWELFVPPPATEPPPAPAPLLTRDPSSIELLRISSDPLDLDAYKFESDE